MFEGSSCTSLKTATSDSIARETMTTTRKRNSKRRARVAVLSRSPCPNSSSTTVCASSIAAIAMVNMAMQSRIELKRLVSVNASLGCTALQSSMPEKAIKAKAEAANKTTMAAKPNAKRRSENLFIVMAIPIKLYACHSPATPIPNISTIAHRFHRTPTA